VLFVSKDENLTKSHAKYLESKLVHLARTANRYSVENSNNSYAASLPSSDRDAMEEFLSHIRILLGAFNHLILEKRPGAVISPESEDMFALPEYESGHALGARREFSLFVSGLRAEAIQTDEGLVVLKGSEAAENITNVLQPGYEAIRNDFIDSEILKAEKNKYVFQEDALFKSPSAAASVIVGYNINGLEVWRDFTGKTWSEIEEKHG
jgi:Domain of unknown function (DUF4357)